MDEKTSIEKMKAFKKYLICVILLVSYSGYARISSEELEKPTVKVGLMYTIAAKESYEEDHSKTFEQALADQQNNLVEIFNENFQNSYEIAFTGIKELKNYQEPKHRERKSGDIGYDEYLYFPFKGMNQIVDEMLFHRELKNLLTTESEGSYDATANKDYIDLDELDEQYLIYAEESIPDILIIIADDNGEPILPYDQILKDYSGTELDEILFGAMSVETMSIDHALAITFFSFFCEAENATINYDLSDIVESTTLMGYWELYNINLVNANLTASNVNSFKTNAAKLQLRSQTSNIINRDIDFTCSFMIYDVEQYQILEPLEDGDATTIISDETDPNQKGAAIFTTEVYKISTSQQSEEDPEQLPPPPPPIPKATSAAFRSCTSASLPVKFDGNTNTTAYYGIQDYYNDDNMTTIEIFDGKRAAKTTKKAGTWMEAYTEIADDCNFTNLEFTDDQFRLSLDINAPAPNLKVRIELYDKDNHFRVMADAITKKTRTWETLIFDFKNHTGSIPLKTGTKYDKVRIYFDFNNAGTGQIFYWDDLRFTEPLTLPVSFDKPEAYYELDHPDNDDLNTILEEDNGERDIVAKTTVTNVSEIKIHVGSLSGFDFSVNKKRYISLLAKTPLEGTKVQLLITKNDGTSIMKEAKTAHDDKWDELVFDFQDLTTEYKNLYVIFKPKTGESNLNGTFAWDNLQFFGPTIRPLSAIASGTVTTGGTTSPIAGPPTSRRRTSSGSSSPGSRSQQKNEEEMVTSVFADVESAVGIDWLNFTENAQKVTAFVTAGSNVQIMLADENDLNKTVYVTGSETSEEKEGLYKYVFDFKDKIDLDNNYVHLYLQFSGTSGSIWEWDNIEISEEAPLLKLPVTFEIDITADNQTEYVTLVNGITTSVKNGTGDDGNYFEIKVPAGEANNRGALTIEEFEGIVLNRYNNKLKMDVKRGNGDIDSDVIKMELSNEDGDILTSTSTLTETNSTGFTPVDLTFEAEEQIVFTSMKIWFNDNSTDDTEKTFYVDNIDIYQEPEILVSGFIDNSNPHLFVGTQTEDPKTTVKVMVKIENNGTAPAENLTVYVALPNMKDDRIVNRYLNIDSETVEKPEGTNFNTNTGEWEIPLLDAPNSENDNTMLLTFSVDVAYVAGDFTSAGELEQPSPYDIKLTVSESGANEDIIKVDPWIGADLQVKIVDIDGKIYVTVKESAQEYFSNKYQVLNDIGVEISYGSNISQTKYDDDNRKINEKITRVDNSTGEIINFDYSKGSSSDPEANKVSVRLTHATDKFKAGDKSNRDFNDKNDYDFIYASDVATYDLMIVPGNDPFEDVKCGDTSADLDFEFYVVAAMEEDIDFGDVDVTFNFPTNYLIQEAEGEMLIPPSYNHSLTVNYDDFSDANIPEAINLLGLGNLKWKKIELKVNTQSLNHVAQELLVTLGKLDERESNKINNVLPFPLTSPALLKLDKAPLFQQVDLSPDAPPFYLDFKIRNYGIVASEVGEFEIFIPPTQLRYMDVIPTTVTVDKNGSVDGKWKFRLPAINPGGLGLNISIKLKHIESFNPPLNFYSICSPNSWSSKMQGQYRVTDIDPTPFPKYIPEPIDTKPSQASVNVTSLLTLYPNPFTNTFKMVYERAENASEQVVATVYDLSGRVALVQQFSVGNVAKTELEIDGSNLAIGHYIIELNDGSGIPKRGKLIKER